MRERERERERERGVFISHVAMRKHEKAQGTAIFDWYMCVKT